MKKITNRIGSTIVACLSAATVLCTSAMLSVAATAPTNQSIAPWENNHPSTGSLTINKQEETTKKPVKGAEFTITQITKIKNKDITLTTRQGWRELAKNVDALNDGTLATNETTRATEKKMSTSDDGKAKFDQLALGLYEVKESKVPAGYSSTIKPFYVTIPQIIGAKTTTSTYQYDISVTPKNKDVTSKITKKANTTKLVGAGDTISYTIQAEINKTRDSYNPARDLTKDDLQGYAVFDDALTNAYTTVDENAITEVKVGDTKLEKTKDYTISTTDQKNGRKRLQVTFTDAGLTKIATAVNTNANVKVTVELSFTIAANPPQSVENEFGFVPGHGKNETPADPVKPTPNPGSKPGVNPNPVTKFRQFKFKKVSAKNNTTLLQGAKFKLFAEKSEAEKCAKNPEDAACTSASSSKFGEKETQADGTTEAYMAKVGETFYAVETKAPNQYVRSTEVLEITVEDKNNSTPYEFTVENIAHADSDFWFTLPKTGAAGVALFAIIGIILVSTGAIMHAQSKRK